jgi:glutamyl-Q tRNA(Asp) synthetase
MKYRGRFAPSPTGPLHFGSLVAAVASYLDARANAGEWIVRMEDLDPARTLVGADEEILADLEFFGFQFQWDDAVVRQSERTKAYREAFDRLKACDLIYPCGCSRKEIADSTLGADSRSGRRYPGTCADGLPLGRTPRAWRIHVNGSIDFNDRVQGTYHQDLAADVGDFVLLRADGVFAYQLAVVVDDAAQGITDVVRGADLLDSTPRQIYLQRVLNVPTPRYLHVPVAVDREGYKLSKQTGAQALDRSRAGELLHSALTFLRQEPPAELRRAGVDEIWAWSIAAWSPQRLPPVPSIPI